MRLYDYCRSTAAYRVRIALNLKELAWEPVPVALVKGEQRSPGFLAENPQGLVPLLVDGEARIGQSLAILEYLDEVYPEPPLLPDDPLQRALARRLALIVACEVHPLNNLRVRGFLADELGVPEEGGLRWYRHWVHEGLAAMDAILRAAQVSGSCCIGDRPSLADLCLVPQLYNARRFDCPLQDFPILTRIDAHLAGLPAFAAAVPEAQPDFPR